MLTLPWMRPKTAWVICARSKTCCGRYALRRDFPLGDAGKLRELFRTLLLRLVRRRPHSAVLACRLVVSLPRLAAASCAGERFFLPI